MRKWAKNCRNSVTRSVVCSAARGKSEKRRDGWRPRVVPDRVRSNINQYIESTMKLCNTGSYDVILSSFSTLMMSKGKYTSGKTQGPVSIGNWLYSRRGHCGQVRLHISLRSAEEGRGQEGPFLLGVRPSTVSIIDLLINSLLISPVRLIKTPLHFTNSNDTLKRSRGMKRRFLQYDSPNIDFWYHLATVHLLYLFLTRTTIFLVALRSLWSCRR